jgi:tetratricopeptide (TPR) repeat protein
VQGEQELDLPPLVEEDAVELFVTRARAVRPEVERTDAVQELCERLDRLPLAIELAAARTKLLAPEALLDRLGQRLDLLKGGRDADPRHATLRATIAWSHDLLDPDEQQLFARLSVFAAGCTLESAELVCDADPDTLESLLDKSLLRRRTGALGEDRYWMLETIREYAAEQLAAAGDEELFRRRHAERMLQIARAAHLSLETGIGEAPQRHDLVLAERHDVRSALDWADAADPRLGLEIVLVLENFWVAADPGEGARRLAGLLERDGALPAELVPRVLRLQGNHAARSGDPQLGIRRYEESIAAYRELGDDRGAAVVLVRVAANVIGRGEVAQGRAMAEEALQLARRLGTAWVEAQALGVLGQADQAEGDLESAWERARHSVRIAEACGFRWWQAGELINVLELGLELGYLAEAEDAGREGLRLATAIEDRFRLLAALVGLARVELELGRLERAGRLWGAATDSLEREPIPGYAFGELEAPLIETTDPGFLAGTEAGRDGGLEAAVELAIRQR